MISLGLGIGIGIGIGLGLGPVRPLSRGAGDRPCPRDQGTTG